MIDELIFKNLNNKLMRELAKGNQAEVEDVVKRMNKLYESHTNDSLGTMIYFTVRGIKKITETKVNEGLSGNEKS